MLPVILAVAPVFGLILLGFLLQRFGFPGQGFWSVSERLTRFVLLPALLVQSVSSSGPVGGVPPLTASLILAVVCMAGVLQGMRHAVNLHGADFRAALQGILRSNAYVGLALAPALLGPGWAVLSATALLALASLTHLVCGILGRHDGRDGPKAAVRALAVDPLVLACAAGLILKALSWPLPDVVADGLDLLGRGALPLGLLACGASLRFQGLSRSFKAVAASSVTHLALLPLLAALFCTMLGANQTTRLAVVLFAAAPAWISPGSSGREQSEDEPRAHILTAQTLISAISLPAMLILLG